MSNEKYEYNGVSGLANIGEDVGINSRTLRTRIKDYGMSLEEAISMGPNMKPIHKYNGIQGLNAIAESVGLNPAVLKSRVYRGMTIEEAIALGVPKARKKPTSPRRHKNEREVEQCLYPDLLSDIWKLALGMEIRQ